MGVSDGERMREENARADLKKIFSAAIEAVEPARLIGQALDGAIDESIPGLIDKASRIFLLAIGKASAAMALEAERRLGPKIVDALAVTPNSIEVCRSGNSKIRFVAG